MSREFKAYVVSETRGGVFTGRIESKPIQELPAGDVLIRVHYSSLNYKDALSATGNKGVTKNFPHTPGIDVAGVVEQSSSSAFASGDEVIVTGYDLGSNTDGGFAEYVRVPADWIVMRPPSLALREAMMFGTAGLTAALSAHKLMKHCKNPHEGQLIVTGATGGVGCIAVGILSKLGYHIVAVTGKKDAKPFLFDLGAEEVMAREELLDTSHRPLLTSRWVGGVDTVGGAMLDSLIRATRFDGVVTTCGNILSAELSTSVYPFILRGVSLVGINSAFTPMALRTKMWRRLASEWKLPQLENVTTEIPLGDVHPFIEKILGGQVTGRVIINTQS